MKRMIFAGILLILMSMMQGCAAGIIHQTTEKDLQAVTYDETKNKLKKMFYKGSHSISFYSAPSSIKITTEGFQVIPLKGGKQVSCEYESIGDPFVKDWGPAAQERFGVHMNGCAAQIWFEQKESAIMFAQSLYTLKHQAEEYKVTQSLPSRDTASVESKVKVIKTDVDTLPLPVIPDDTPYRAPDFGTYHALVIGNNDYRHLPKLRTAVNDAKIMAAILRDKYGFELKLLLNATRADILRTLNGYRRILGQRDNFLIYYAGHGWLDKEADAGYWLPIDASPDNEINWVSNFYITSLLKAISAKHVLVVADSCYSGKLARGVHIQRRTTNYYARISKKKARSVLSSGGLEPVADGDGKGSHSVFASALIDTLTKNDGIMDGTEVFNKIRRPVMLNSDQTPEFSDIRKAGHDGGDFLFVKQKR